MTTLPPPLPTLDTERLRQELAGLIDYDADKPEWFVSVAKELAVDFCASLPRIFGSDLDRLTLWDRIATAIQSAYAKTIDGDLDLFVQHVCEHIKAEPAKAVADDDFVNALQSLYDLPAESRADWLKYLTTHLIPVLVLARRRWKDKIGGAA
jgi:hypothetical protein